MPVVHGQRQHLESSWAAGRSEYGLRPSAPRTSGNRQPACAGARRPDTQQGTAQMPGSLGCGLASGGDRRRRRCCRAAAGSGPRAAPTAIGGKRRQPCSSGHISCRGGARRQRAPPGCVHRAALLPCLPFCRRLPPCLMLPFPLPPSSPPRLSASPPIRCGHGVAAQLPLRRSLQRRAQLTAD